MCMKHCGNPVGCSNIAYPKLVLQLMPTGLRGLMMAVKLSAIMSSLTSIFNSASTLFTMDFWRKFRSRASERELLIVGRVFIVVLCGLSILWIPLVKSSQSGQLFVYIQAVQGYLGTPIGALFLWAILWGRMNEQGAFWGIAVGHTCGVIRMVLDFVYPAPECGDPETRPPVLFNVHYTYFSQLVLVIISLTIVTVSLLTKAQDKKSTVGMTWWSRFKPGLEEETTEVESLADKQTPSDGLQVAEPESEEELDTCGKCRSLTEFICGIPKESEQHFSFEEEALEKRAFLRERPIWRRILNINAATGLIIMAFLIGFFR